MQCPSCGYYRKTTDKISPEQCPLCHIYYNKIQCKLYWALRISLLPDNITKAYVITPGLKWYAINNALKNPVKQLILSEEQNKQLINALNLTIPLKEIDTKELIQSLNFEQLNIIYTATSHKIFDTNAKCSHQQDKTEIETETLKNTLGELSKKNTPIVTCQQCGEDMIKSTIGYGSLVGIMMGLIIFLLGLFFLFFLFWNIIGAIIGIVLMIKGLLMGGTKQKIWKCQGCGFYFNCL